MVGTEEEAMNVPLYLGTVFARARQVQGYLVLGCILCSHSTNTSGIARVYTIGRKIFVVENIVDTLCNVLAK